MSNVKILAVSNDLCDDHEDIYSLTVEFNKVIYHIELNKIICMPSLMYAEPKVIRYKIERMHIIDGKHHMLRLKWVDGFWVRNMSIVEFLKMLSPEELTQFKVEISRSSDLSTLPNHFGSW
jgi:hypothetical protein